MWRREYRAGPKGSPCLRKSRDRLPRALRTALRYLPPPEAALHCRQRVSGAKNSPSARRILTGSCDSSKYRVTTAIAAAAAVMLNGVSSGGTSRTHDGGIWLF